MPTWTRLSTAIGAGLTALLIGMGTTAAAAPPAPPNPPQPPGVVAPHGLVGPNVPSLPVTTPELTFVAIAPCRIANTTRATTQTRIGVNATRNFTVRGTFGFAPQGGKSGGCGIPASASAIAATVNTINGAVQTQYPTGYLLGFPTGGAVPTANFMAYRNGATSSNPTLTLRATGEPSLSIKSLAGSVALAIDVTGYYTQPIEGLIYTGSSTASGYVYSGSPRLLSVTWIATGVADVTVDRDVSYCTPVAGAYTGTTYFADARGFSGNKVRVYTWYVDSSSHLPVLTNNYVYLTISC